MRALCIACEDVIREVDNGNCAMDMAEAAYRCCIRSWYLLQSLMASIPVSGCTAVVVDVRLNTELLLYTFSVFVAALMASIL